VVSLATSFLVLDQPSQAFFPRERQEGGDLSELSDTDRDAIRLPSATVRTRSLPALDLMDSADAQTLSVAGTPTRLLGDGMPCGIDKSARTADGT
jgi:hypothetical protein